MHSLYVYELFYIKPTNICVYESINWYLNTQKKLN